MREILIFLTLSPVLLIILVGIAFKIYNLDDVKYLASEVNSFEVVIARYDEDLSWITQEFPTEKVTVYNKGKDDLNLPSNCKLLKLPNIGRESQTYLYHIINNYNQLAERVLFLQGDPFSERRFIFTPLNNYKKISKTRCNNIIAAHCILMDLHVENQLMQNLKNTKWSNTISSKYNFSQFKKEFVDLGEKPPHSLYISYEANFAVDRHKILSRNIDYYKKIITTLDNVAPIEGHYMERLWDSVFISKINENRMDKIYGK